jgi:hypothetical protein
MSYTGKKIYINFSYPSWGTAYGDPKLSRVKTYLQVAPHYFKVHMRNCTEDVNDDLEDDKAWWKEWRDACDTADIVVIFKPDYYSKSKGCKKEMNYINKTEKKHLIIKDHDNDGITAKQLGDQIANAV